MTTRQKITRQTGSNPKKPSGNPADWRRNFERYTALARNPSARDDDVTRENYYQHAEHYLRLMSGAAEA